MEYLTCHITKHCTLSFQNVPSLRFYLTMLDGAEKMYIRALDTPEVGGDTAFVNYIKAYNCLSPALKERPHGLKALHTGIEQQAARWRCATRTSV